MLVSFSTFDGHLTGCYDIHLSSISIHLDLPSLEIRYEVGRLRLSIKTTIEGVSYFCYNGQQHFQPYNTSYGWFNIRRRCSENTGLIIVICSLSA